MKKELNLGSNLWKSDNCYWCGNTYNKKSFWAVFESINGTVWQVPICDKCAKTDKRFTIALRLLERVFKKANDGQRNNYKALIEFGIFDGHGWNK